MSSDFNFDEALDAHMEKHRAFYAFSNEQFMCKALMCIRYANCGGGLIMPAVNAKSFSEGFTKLVQQKIIYTKERYSKKPSLKTNCTTTRLLHL